MVPLLDKEKIMPGQLMQLAGEVAALAFDKQEIFLKEYQKQLQLRGLTPYASHKSEDKKTGIRLAHASAAIGRASTHLYMLRIDNPEKSLS